LKLALTLDHRKLKLATTLEFSSFSPPSTQAPRTLQTSVGNVFDLEEAHWNPCLHLRQKRVVVSGFYIFEVEGFNSLFNLN
jgi:hypothetical protein